MISQSGSKSDRAPNPLRSGRWRDIAAVMTCAIALVLLAAMATIPVDPVILMPGLYSMPPGLGLILFAFLYAVVAMLTENIRERKPYGLIIDFQRSVLVAAFLALGPTRAVLTGLIGAVLAELSRFYVGARLNQRSRPMHEAVSGILLSVGGNSTIVLLLGLLYVRLGGSLPLLIGTSTVVTPLVAMLLADAVLHVVTTAWIARQDGQALLSRQWIGISIPSIIVAIFTIPLSMLLPIAYYDLPPVAFAILVFGIFLVFLLFRMSDEGQQTLQRRIDELATLNSIGQSIASSLAMNDLMHSLYDQVTHLFDAEFFYIALYSSDAAQTLSFPFAVQNGQRVTIEAIPDVNGVIEYITHTRSPLLIRGSVKAELIRLGIQPTTDDEGACFLGVPLVIDDDVMGVLALHHYSRPNAYDQSDVAVLSAIASQAAIALHNAGLYNRVWEMADELALLNNVSSVVTATLDLDIVLDTTCAVVIQIGHADKTGIFLISEDAQTLRLVHAIGLSEDYVAQFQSIRRDGDEGPIQIIRQRTAVAISDVRTDPRGLGWRTLSEIEGYVGLLAVPLITNDQAIGFLAAYYQQPHLFGKSELDLMSTLANQVAVTVVNARLFHDTQARAQEMSRLVEASRAFTVTLDLHSVAEKVLDELAALLTPDLGALLLLGPEGNLLRPLVVRGVEAVDVMVPSGSIAEAIATCKAITLPNTGDDLALLRRLDLKSLYVIPLVSQEKVIGIVMIGHETLRQLSMRERQLAEALVNQASTVVRNAQSYSQIDADLSARVIELSAIEGISRRISGSLDLETIIDDVLEMALTVTHADSISCGLIYDAEILSLSERYSAENNMPPVKRLSRLGDGIMGRVIRTAEVARIGDVQTDPDYLPSYLPGIQSVICVPIIHKQECVGVLNAESRNPNAFTESHARFMGNVADHAAIAIGNARLFEERQLQIDNLIKLRDLSLSLLSAVSLNEVMSLIVEYSLIIARAKDVHLYLYDRATDTLTFGGSLWLDGRENFEASKPERGGTTWQVARTGRSQIVEDVSKSDHIPKFRSGPGYTAIARIAIKRTDRVLGVLVIAYREPHYFTEVEIRTLDLLANQAATAIENAQLFGEVRVARDQMQVILDSTRDGMMLLGPGGVLVLANPAAERLLNQALQRFTGTNILRLIARLHRDADDPENQKAIVDAVHSIMANIKKMPHESTRVSFQVYLEGTLVDVDASVLPVHDKGSQISGRLIVLRDVTEERSVDRFRWEATNMIVHDLRAPLSAVISSLRLVQDMVSSNDLTDLDQVVSIALNSGESQMYMIESILEIAKLESRMMLLNMGVCSLCEVVDRAVLAIDLTANTAGIHVSNHVDHDLPPLWIDEAQIRRVLINLLDNALRHTPSDGEVRIEAVLENKNCVRIGVIDTGKGIPVDARGRIFEKFYQLSHSALRGARGVGLGLTFCKLAVEAHHGEIWVDDGPEGGAAFWFTLPLATPEQLG